MFRRGELIQASRFLIPVVPWGWFQSCHWDKDTFHWISLIQVVSNLALNIPRMPTPAPFLATAHAPKVQILPCMDPWGTSQKPSKPVVVGNYSLKISPQEMLHKPKVQLHSRAVSQGISVDEAERVHPAGSTCLPGDHRYGWVRSKFFSRERMDPIPK